MTEVQLYDYRSGARGVEQVWFDWSLPLPRKGEYILLDEGHWYIKGVVHRPGAGHVEVYAIPP